MEKCGSCGSEEITAFQDCKICQRCGTKIYSDGSQEYDPREIEGNIDHYDRRHNNDNEDNNYRNNRY